MSLDDRLNVEKPDEKAAGQPEQLTQAAFDFLRSDQDQRAHQGQAPRQRREAGEQLVRGPRQPPLLDEQPRTEKHGCSQQQGIGDRRARC